MSAQLPDQTGAEPPGGPTQSPPMRSEADGEISRLVSALARLEHALELFADETHDEALPSAEELAATEERLEGVLARYLAQTQTTRAVLNAADRSASVEVIDEVGEALARLWATALAAFRCTSSGAEQKQYADAPAARRFLSLLTIARESDPVVLAKNVEGALRAAEMAAREATQVVRNAREHQADWAD